MAKITGAVIGCKGMVAMENESEQCWVFYDNWLV